MTRDREPRRRLSTRQRNRSSYAGKTGTRCSGTSRPIECTTTVVRSTSPTARRVTRGQIARSCAWSAGKPAAAISGRYTGDDFASMLPSTRQTATWRYRDGNPGARVHEPRRGDRRADVDVRLRVRPEDGRGDRRHHQAL